MNKIGSQFTSIDQVRGQYLKQPGKAVQSTTKAATFQEILEAKAAQENSELRFSKHATMRLQSRSIELSAIQQEKLYAGAKKAEAKGIKESLVMVDSLAFIVNVPSKTVVTAMDHKESIEHIFTNIDGVVIM